MKKNQYALILSFLIFLAACGGNASDSTSESETTKPNEVEERGGEEETTDASEESTEETVELSETALAGEGLFEIHCLSCHQLHEDLVGPALAGMTERKDKEWVVAFIKNAQGVIDSGDEYAVALYEKYGEAAMTNFEALLSDEEIDQIIAYVEEAGATKN